MAHTLGHGIGCLCQTLSLRSEDYAGAESKIQSGMCNMEKHGKRGRLWRRLQLASVEVALGKGALEDAEKQLQLIGIAPPVQDITDELLHVRSIMANAPHAQVSLENDLAGQKSYEAAVRILKTERPDYWIPVVATIWLLKIAKDLRSWKGWPIRCLPS
ncbi:hypothetical protein M406DRAFT_335309 [Cryphonectria parasitica EP155]|uniref:Uncharacterized protein n=1 Tax=Cryphonectria parasitica (strain ATCC 38755 / EP155) TaxID=660469 RepID=A0A9P4XRB8_CRYP1|nr:uncharacterized protein M406DRAFT_335309 [Cryphonectria parasitica EP155]KAF3760117.1 hypothetical protein M406DRAFT_335309 [Cryphonectria parasitica EP155]